MQALGGGGIAGQVNAFVIIQNLFAFGETEIVTRPRVLCGYNSESIDNRLWATLLTKTESH